MTTISQIAKACHMSVSTVSNVLSGKPGASEATRELVFLTAEELDFDFEKYEKKKKGK